MPYYSSIPSNQYSLNSDNGLCPTSVQHKKKFDLGTKYLYKRKNIYYFSKRINGVPYKISLQSSNLEYCKILRNKILKKLKKLKHSEYNPIDDFKNDELNKNRKIIDSKDISLNNITKIIEDEDIEFLFDLTINLNGEQDTYKTIHKSDFCKLINRYKKLDIPFTLESHFKELEKNLLNKLDSKVQIIPECSENSVSSEITVNIDGYINDYLQHRINYDKVSNSTIKNYKAAFSYLKYFIDKHTVYDLKFFKDVQKKFQNLPKNFFKYDKYNKKSYSELLEIKKQEEYETLNNKTINSHLNSYRLFFDYLIYEQILEENPIKLLRSLPEDNITNKEEFTKVELNKIFSSDMDEVYKNICKFSLYTGLRREEILSIKKQNVTDELIEIDLEDTSSKRHKRIIPIHKNIIDLVSFQKENNSGLYLFFNGNISDSEVRNVGKRINRRLKKIVPSQYKTFHSFRKNFSQEIELNTDSEEKTKKYLMGHTMEDITHSVYNRGKVNLKKLKDCIEQITFEY